MEGGLMKAFRVVLFVVLSALMILCSCAHYQRIPPETTHTVYSVHGGEDAQLRQYAPLFLTYQTRPPTTISAALQLYMMVKGASKYLWTAKSRSFIT